MFEFIKYMIFRIFTGSLFLEDAYFRNSIKDSIFVFKKGLFKKVRYRLSKHMDYDNMILLNRDYLLDTYTYLRKRSRRKNSPEVNKYWRVVLSKDNISISPVYNLFKSDYKNIDKDTIIFYMKRDSKVFLEWLEDMIGDNKIKELNNIFSNHFLDDIGVDLANESVEVFSKSNRYDMRIDRLDSAISNIDPDGKYYIIRKVLGGFYSIYSISRLFEILDEIDDDYIICNYNEIQENIIPPTQFFVSTQCA